MAACSQLLCVAMYVCGYVVVRGNVLLGYYDEFHMQQQSKFQ